MALISCPECDSSISSAANSCPQCGYPIKDKSENVINVSIDNSPKGSWIKLLLRIVLYSVVAVITFAFAYMFAPQIIQRLFR